MNTQKRKKQTLANDSIFEQLKDLGGGIIQGVTNDSIGGVTTEIIKSIFNSETNISKSKYLNEQVIFEEKKQSQTFKSIPEFRQTETTIFTASEANLAREVEALRQELKKTVKELTELNTAVLEVEKAVEKTPNKVGKYHLSFFAYLRRILKLFRQQISHSRLWLEETFAKKRKRNYWAMFKKHGTSFGLSSERVIATQSG